MEGSRGDKRAFHWPITFKCVYDAQQIQLTGEDVLVSVLALVFRPLALLSALLRLCLQLLESLWETDTIL